MKKYKRKMIDDISDNLKNTPALDKKEIVHTKKDTIKLLLKDIEELQKKHYSLEQISELLRKNGLDISLASLKSNLHQVKKEKTTKIKKNILKDDFKDDSNKTKSTFNIYEDTSDI